MDNSCVGRYYDKIFACQSCQIRPSCLKQYTARKNKLDKFKRSLEVLHKKLKKDTRRILMDRSRVPLFSLRKEFREAENSALKKFRKDILFSRLAATKILEQDTQRIEFESLKIVNKALSDLDDKYEDIVKEVDKKFEEL